MNLLFRLPRAARGVLLSFAAAVPSCLEDEPTPPVESCPEVLVQQGHMAPIPTATPGVMLTLAKGERAEIASILGEDGRVAEDAIEREWIVLGETIGEGREAFLEVSEDAPAGAKFRVEVAVSPSEKRYCAMVVVLAVWSMEIVPGEKVDGHGRAPLGEHFTLRASIVGTLTSTVEYRWGLFVADGQPDPQIDWLEDSDDAELELLAMLPTRYSVFVVATDQQGYAVTASIAIDVSNGPIARIRRNVEERAPDVMSLGEASRLRFWSDQSELATDFAWQVWRLLEIEEHDAKWVLWHRDAREWIDGDELSPPRRITEPGTYRVVLRASMGDEFQLAYDSFTVR